METADGQRLSTFYSERIRPSSHPIDEYDHIRPPVDEGARGEEAEEENPLRHKCWLETPAVAKSVSHRGRRERALAESLQQVFQVCYSLPKYTRSRSVQLYIEGTYVGGHWFRPFECAKDTFRTMANESSNGERNYEYKLAFDDLVGQLPRYGDLIVGHYR